MAHIDDGDLALVAQPLDVVQNLGLARLVEGGERLVHQEEARVGQGARPMATRCFSPPERGPGRRSSRLPIPRRSTTRSGKPFTSSASFGNWFADACFEAKVDKTPHGLRKNCAIHWAERGVTASQLCRIMAWSSIKEAEVYCREAEGRKMAAMAAQLQGFWRQQKMAKGNGESSMGDARCLGRSPLCLGHSATTY
jgi:hypothetical protein